MQIGVKTCKKTCMQHAHIPTELPFCVPPLLVGMTMTTTRATDSQTPDAHIGSLNCSDSYGVDLSAGGAGAGAGAGDLHMTSLLASVTSPEECQKLCKQEERCKFFTW